MSEMPSTSLAGWGITLEPLVLAHAEALLEASSDGELWKLHYTSAPGPGIEEAERYIAKALAGQHSGLMQPYAVIVDGRVVGSTRLYDIDYEVPTCAIGYTWYGASLQRTHVNTACKRLLLGHAFDERGMRTVYFHTSHENLRSQAAIERLGARKDGVIRQHKRQKDGSLRDTVAYSILDSEWPAIRDALDARLADIPR